MAWLLTFPDDMLRFACRRCACLLGQPAGSFCSALRQSITWLLRVYVLLSVCKSSFTMLQLGAKSRIGNGRRDSTCPKFYCPLRWRHCVLCRTRPQGQRATQPATQDPSINPTLHQNPRSWSRNAPTRTLNPKPTPTFPAPQVRAAPAAVGGFPGRAGVLNDPANLLPTNT